MDILTIIGCVILGVAFFIPTAIYGGIIGDRIAMNEFGGRFIKRVFCIMLFSVIGAAIFPVTYLIMLANADDVSVEVDRLIDRFILR